MQNYITLITFSQQQIGSQNYTKEATKKKKLHVEQNTTPYIRSQETFEQEKTSMLGIYVNKSIFFFFKSSLKLDDPPV